MSVSDTDTSQYSDGKLLDYVVKKTHQRYGKWVEIDDLRQELWVYYLGEGGKHFEKWHANGDHFRVKLSLLGAAKQYCENEKAIRSGYDFEDIAWYDPNSLSWLVEAAFDPQFAGHVQRADDEQPQGKRAAPGPEGGTVLAMVLDVRRAVSRYFPRTVTLDDFAEETEAGYENLRKLADWLGGEFPDSPGYQRGRRQVMSNARANAIIRDGGNERIHARDYYVGQVGQ